MEQLEAQLDALWDENRQKKRERISELNAELMQRVRVDVNATLQRVRSTLASEQPDLERQVEKLLRMADEFAAGVEIWQQKAMSSIESIGEEQNALGNMVRDVKIRTCARKEDMLKRQEQRTEELRSMCMERFREVELKL